MVADVADVAERGRLADFQLLQFVEGVINFLIEAVVGAQVIIIGKV